MISFHRAGWHRGVIGHDPIQRNLFETELYVDVYFLVSNEGPQEALDHAVDGKELR